MIRSFKHKGLERFFVRGSTAGIQASHGRRLRLILGRLNVAEDSRDMDLPGLYLHRLKGSKGRAMKGAKKGAKRGKASARWSVRVSANWRVTFSFSGRDVVEVDYEDYH